MCYCILRARKPTRWKWAIRMNSTINAMIIKSCLAGCLPALIFCFLSCNPRLSNGLRVHDLQKDVEIITTKGTLIVRLSDSTPLHRDNFLRLAKSGFYDSVLFHRVIRNFMVQSGDPGSRRPKDSTEL